MASYDPVIKNGAGGAIFYMSLCDAAVPGSFDVNPTIAAGDFKISKDGGAFANLTTLPVVTPASTAQIKLTLSQAETNADNITILCVDQTSPKEWCDAFVRIQTAAGNFDTVQADADDIQARLPTALVGGRMDSNVGSMGTDVITSAALATSAVTEIQTGLATSAAVAVIQADTDDIQARLPTALVAGRMNSSVGAMANDTLTAAALATDAVTEIQTGLATSASIAGLPTTASIAALQADTDNLQTRLPAALVGGRIDASVGSMANDVLTAAALATDAVNEMADGFLDRNMATGTDSGAPAARTVRQALRFSRNKWTIAAGTLTVMKEDDVTISWTSAISTAVGNPVSGSDPA